MIFIEANNLNTVYGIQNTGSRYIAYVSAWDGSTILPCGCGTPPAGLLDPEGVFNWAYNTTLAPIGVWNSAIGWATQVMNTGQRTIQFSDTGAFYIDTPLGVYRFVPSAPNANNGTWTKIK
jgi:hypothetical protein